MLEVAEAISSSRPAFVHVKGAPGMRKSLAGASLMRTIGVPGFAMAVSVASRAASCTELHRSRGTEGSNPSLSSGESDEL
jgi:hypothetical protein